MGELSKPPPILRLPTELQVQIVSCFTTEALKCCLTKSGTYCNNRNFTWHTIGYNDPFNDHETIIVTHPAILLLRSISKHFLNLIPISQDLLLQIERHRSTPRTQTGLLRACCVCLRLRPSNQFAISTHSGPQQRASNYTEQHLGWRARYRFCRDCGFHTYPDPHPELPPRRQQRRRGTAPMRMTTYAPGTKLVFLQDEPNKSGYATWVWCMDCRLLKTYTRYEQDDCRFLCEDCCTRLECWVRWCRDRGPKVVHFQHRGYAGIAETITAENRRRAYRLSVGAVYVAEGRSFLLRNVELPYGDGEVDGCE
jgi:hypothetical protein